MITSIGDAESKLEVSHFLVKKVRPLVLCKLEVLRSEGRIGKALEAQVIWELSDKDFVTLILCGWGRPQLEELFGVSRAHVYGTDGEEHLEVLALTV